VLYSWSGRVANFSSCSLEIPPRTNGRITGKLQVAALLSPAMINRAAQLFRRRGQIRLTYHLPGVAIRAVRIREVDPRTKRIGRSPSRIECWHARRIGCDTIVVLHRGLGMCARQVPSLTCCRTCSRNREQ
jgi:hypothetical protein